MVACSFFHSFTQENRICSLYMRVNMFFRYSDVYSSIQGVICEEVISKQEFCFRSVKNQYVTMKF